MLQKITFVFLVFSSVLCFANDTIRCTSKIKEATVFFTGSQLSRSAQTRIPKGKHLLIIEKLPQNINPQSIQVEGFKNGEILSVKHHLNFNNQAIKNEAIKSFEKQIKAQELKVREIDNKITVFDLEERLLLDNSNLAKSSTGSSIAEIKEAASFYRLKLNEIRQAKLQLMTEVDVIYEAIDLLNKKLNEIIAKEVKTYSEIWVTLDSKIEYTGEINFSYYTESAGWTPLYDFRVDEINKPLSIVYNANVFQSTGENWKNVQMKLSTYDPSLTGEKPNLEKWILGKNSSRTKSQDEATYGSLKGFVYDQKTNAPLSFAQISIMQNGVEIAQLISNKEGEFGMKPISEGSYTLSVYYTGYNAITNQNIYIYKNGSVHKDFAMTNRYIVEEEKNFHHERKKIVKRENIVSTGESKSDDTYYYIDGIKVRGSSNLPKCAIEEVSVYGLNVQSNKTLTEIENNSVINMEYRIETPYTIPSDGEDYLVKIKEADIPVTYSYYVAPKLEKDAFLFASLTDWNQLHLLPGKTSIYYQGTFVGSSVIDKKTTSDTLNLSLGRDKNITVSYETNKERNDKKINLGYIKETTAASIVVKNNKNIPITITVEDQFPISERKSIEVERLENSGAKIDENGKLSWELKLSENEKKSINFSYQIRYPKYNTSSY
jgi:hypothetical protein